MSEILLAQAHDELGAAFLAGCNAQPIDAEAAVCEALSVGANGQIWQAVIAAIRQGLITAASNPEAIIAALATMGVVVPPMLVPMIVMGCGWLVKLLAPKPA